MGAREQFAHLLRLALHGEDAPLEQAVDRPQDAARTTGAAPRLRRTRQLPQQLQEGGPRQLVRKEVRRDVLQIVRLVEDEPPVGGQDAAPRVRRLREDERVVHHHHVRLERAGARLRDEALRTEGARPARTVLGRTRQMGAQPFVPQVVQIPVRRAAQPVDEVRKRRPLVLRERPVAALHVLAEHPQTEVVGASLEERRAELRRLVPQRLRRARQVA